MTTRQSLFVEGEDGAVVQIDLVPSRLVIVDDHRVFAEAIAHALSGEPELEIVGLAHSVANLGHVTQRHRCGFGHLTLSNGSGGRQFG